MKRTSIVLVDDHALLRAGIRALLEKIEGVTVVAEGGSGHDALTHVASLRPDVVLMDIAMPDLNGLEALTRITRQFSETRVVILSMYMNEEYVLKAMRSGAAGYLLKNAKPDELQLALELVVGGATYISPTIAGTLADYLRRAGQSEDPLAQLTSRQREILQLIAEGQPTKKIAENLGISPKTVEMHRAQLMERLKIHDVAGLVRYAIRVGMVEAGR